MPRPHRETPPPPRRGDRHSYLTGADLAARRAELDDLRLRVTVVWGGVLTWPQLAQLAGISAGALKRARLGLRLEQGTIAALLELAQQLHALVQELPGDVAPCEAATWLTGAQRGRLEPHEVPVLERAADLGARLLGPWRPEREVTP